MLCHNPVAMSLAGLDLPAVSRSLAQIADADEELVETYFERLEVVELPAESRAPGVLARREEGLAVRLQRDEQCWMATADSLSGEDFLAALRQVARSWPQTAGSAPELRPPSWPEADADREMLRFPAALQRALRQRLVAFPLRARVRRHRRWLQLVGAQLIPEAQRESFYSLDLRTAWGRRGLLAPTLGEQTVSQVADMLALAFEARTAAPPRAGEAHLVLSPQAAAIFLHEAVAHALEADTLAVGGRVEAAVGLALGGPGLSVLDDPSTAPEPVRRSSDDEGRRVERRWLLRDGVVEQPLADAYWAQRSAALLPGAGRRGGRFDRPTPRSTHLVLLPGETPASDLLTGTGIWVASVSRGRLEAESGHCRLEAACGYTFDGGELVEPVGPFVFEGHLTALLASVERVGDDTAETGAGWCAKGRQRLPVWATTPSVRLSSVRVTP